ncbi:hypothetical protein RJ639_027449 [Escallonia herrerae]|uniref:RNase H type-1 domain-containing protein n=1 Tax=Escallonia herrerae TaxID=1293975 RepID=A0AA88X430_9ASTE|nr:hypothetical protein RJ639_027449 [Escallonia herrerae]
MGARRRYFFYEAFQKMSIPSNCLRKIYTPLYGFSNHSVVCERIIALPIIVGVPRAQVKLMLDFMVVSVPSAYNAILGRTLNQLRAVVSTYHMKMKFPTEHGVGEVKGDQRVARQSYMASCGNRANETLIIEYLRDESKVERGKPVEDLMDIELYPGNPEKTARIGAGLVDNLKLKLVNLLRKVLDMWLFYVDDSSKVGSSGARLILINPEKFMIEYALRFDFQASNNEAEYAVLLVGIRLAHSLRVNSLSVHSDSQLVMNHILGKYGVKDDRMAQYFPAIKTEVVKVLYKKSFSLPYLKCLIPKEADYALQEVHEVAIDYFTKWTEAEPLATITKPKCKKFFRKNVVCRFGVPKVLIADNGK